jgi:hypothetical protein
VPVRKLDFHERARALGEALRLLRQHKNMTLGDVAVSTARPPSDEDKASIRGLGLAVERLRREQELSREQVADRGDLLAATVGEIEAAEIDREPRWGDLRRVAKGLDVELDYLIRLAYQLAPGPAGDRLREGELEADTREP